MYEDDELDNSWLQAGARANFWTQDPEGFLGPVNCTLVTGEIDQDDNAKEYLLVRVKFQQEAEFHMERSRVKQGWFHSPLLAIKGNPLGNNIEISRKIYMESGEFDHLLYPEELIAYKNPVMLIQGNQEVETDWVLGQLKDIPPLGWSYEVSTDVYSWLREQTKEFQKEHGFEIESLREIMLSKQLFNYQSIPVFVNGKLQKKTIQHIEKQGACGPYDKRG